MQAAAVTAWVVEQARALGWDLCGVASVEGLTELERLPQWLERGYAGEMGYLHDARRRSPGRVLEGARSLIVCALNYNTSLPYSTDVPPECSGEPLSNSSPAELGEGSPGEIPRIAQDDTQGHGGARGWISRYAWGDDYHEVLGRKLEALITALREQFREPFEARAYVDTGPIVERVAAKHAGLGWLAKNTCLINEQLGSWLFLGVILTTLELEPSLGPAEAPPPDLCGQCRLCIDACPTGAIVEPYVLDARRCISYLTIELRGNIAVELREPMGRMVFGCDICQDVCPWNRKAPVTSVAQFWPRRVERSKENRASDTAQVKAQRHSEPAPAGEESLPNDSLFTPSLEGLATLSEEEYREAFRASAIKRAKWRALVRNASIALGNCGARPGTLAHTRSVALLERLAASDDRMIAEHARWALTRLRPAPAGAQRSG
jgi:epoxyqueuosine reductase